MLTSFKRSLSWRLLPAALLLGASGIVFALPDTDNEFISTQSKITEDVQHASALQERNLDICERLVTNTERVKIPAVARPPYSRFFKEPGFGTKAQRISNSTVGQVNKPAGNPAQAWNIDESLILLHRYGTDGVHQAVVLDGQNYQELRVLNLPDVHSENLYWSHTDPSVLYFVIETGAQAGRLSQLNVSNNEQTVLKDFAPVCEKAGVTAESGILAKPSYDDDSFGYQCGVSNEKSLAIAYQHSSDTVDTLRLGKGSNTAAGAAPAPLPDGMHYWLQGQLFDKTLKPSRLRLDMADTTAAHTLARKVNDQNVIFQAPNAASPKGCNKDLWNGIGLVIEHALEKPSCKPLINQADNYPPTPEGTELFASAYLSPRWMAMSSRGAIDMDIYSNKRFAPLLSSEVYLVNTDETRETEICRLAHHRSFGSAAKNASYEPVLGEPNVTLSPTATRVLFASDWYDSGLVDTYVLELPAYTPFDINGKWVDKANSYMITEMDQRGDKVFFRRSPLVDPGVRAIVTTGEGRISGNRIDIDYVIDVSVNRKVSGTCLAKVSESAVNILFECKDNYFGRLRTTIVRAD